MFGGEPVFRPAGHEWMFRVRALLPDEPDRAQAIEREPRLRDEARAEPLLADYA